MDDSRLAVTVIVPTFREVENLRYLIDRLSAVRAESPRDLELLLIDDDSRDGSAELVASMGLPWVTFVTRVLDRGLSQSVLEGMSRSSREIIVVMDADLSHPPEKIDDMIDALSRGADIVVGSRFAEGGSTADDWGFLRWINSRIATLLALPLAPLSDPMSGFFALRRATFERGRGFDPVGYKILLELIIKCRARVLEEVPIHFDNRRFGESKLTFREQLQYLRHLRRLYMYKYGTWAHLVQFLLVGLSGLAINLAVLSLLLHLDVRGNLAVAIAIAVSMLWNFALNRRFSFSYARDRSLPRQFIGFIAACSIGAIVNYVVTLEAWHFFVHKQIAAAIGVASGTGFNFLASRFIVFRSKHVRPLP